MVAVANAVPVPEELFVQTEQPAADLSRRALRFGDEVEVAQQVRPAQLAPRQRPCLVRRPAVGNQDAGEVAQQLLGRDRC